VGAKFSQKELDKMIQEAMDWIPPEQQPTAPVQPETKPVDILRERLQAQNQQNQPKAGNV
jgi:hypothetical protein